MTPPVATSSSFTGPNNNNTNSSNTNNSNIATTINQQQQQLQKTNRIITGADMPRKKATSLQQEIHDSVDNTSQRHPKHHHHHHPTRHTHGKLYHRPTNPYSSSNSNNSSTSRLSTPSTLSRSPLRTSERYMNSNYRFLVRSSATESPDAGHKQQHASPQLSVSSGERSIDWELVECVIIPVTEDPRCPICLDHPTAPRVTQCGHYFCWTCLLRYLVATVPDVPAGVSKNWRTCPVCADQFHQKKVKPVHFFQAMQVKVGARCEFVLLKRALSNPSLLLTAECLERDLASLKPSPFCKVTELADVDIVDTILMPERSAIITRMKAIDEMTVDGDGDGERHFLEQALSLLNDQMQSFSSLPPHQQPVQKPKGAPSRSHPQSSDTVFFHQSSDGQYMFLDSLSIKMLKTMYGSYDRFPTRLHVLVNEIEDVGMGRESARRFKHLAGYVPHGATFGLCEVDLTGVVSDHVLAQFGKEIAIRQTARDQRNKREEFESRSAARRNSLDDGYGYWGMRRDGDDDDDDLYYCSEGRNGQMSTSYKEDIINFPPPPGTDAEAPIRPAVWYTRDPPVIRPDTPNSSLLFNLSLEDLPSSSPSSPSSPSTNNSTSHGGSKKGRSKFVLIGGTLHRR